MGIGVSIFLPWGCLVIRFITLVSCQALLALTHVGEQPAIRDDKAQTAQSSLMPSIVQLAVPTGDSTATKELADIYKAANAAFREANVSFGQTNNDGASIVLLETAQRIVAHARKFPTDDSSLPALVTAMSLSSQAADGSKIRSEVIEVMKTNFAKSPAIRSYLRLLASSITDTTDPATELVRDVFRNHPDPLTRAHAAKRLITLLEFRVRFVNSLNSREDERLKYEKAMGKDEVQKLICCVPEAMKEIETYRYALRAELKGQLPSVEVGDVAPETICVNLEGKSVKLSELRGKVVVLDFWAVWCGPCQALIPHQRELVKSQDGKPFVFVGICIDEKKETLTEFLKKEPMPWTHWWDGKKTVTEQWDIAAFPTLYVIDHKGVIRFTTQGYDPKSGKLDELIKDLVNAAEAAK